MTRVSVNDTTARKLLELSRETGWSATTILDLLTRGATEEKLLALKLALVEQNADADYVSDRAPGSGSAPSSRPLERKC